ncbi:type IV secretion system DNA-binding domain-containing protein [Virgibacillus sp. 179-BFC.A HS]|uniref:Type IV secretion system DNA-binding domain-containing protein n=1 Tax=Tigheibacillus jepli TaxID=3035914 RepID=A0ABU5CEA1_9BACI|nr:type IV secretion system DNA-binding domain-containing protein [Virgibacillus sp. 179-BFC.A HS]MDY0404659.1 type IV secretion system DNA-binding domain-containing protein [Virgibacillus sp. 179-BFC.A HS]
MLDDSIKEELTVEVIQVEEATDSKERDMIVNATSTESRPLIGLTKDQPVYWEFAHNQLSNRHLVIGGRPGQGKTYFIQALLMDLSKTGQSAVVIDYSSSYTR